MCRTKGVGGGELCIAALPPSLNPLIPLSMGTKAGVLGFSMGLRVAVLMFLRFVIRLEMRRLLRFVSTEGAGVAGI